jgi:hypothetical protein
MCQRGEHGEPWWCGEHRQRHGTCHKHGGQPCHGSLAPGLSTCRMHGGEGSREKILAGKALALHPRPPGHWQPVKIHPAEALLQEVWHWTGLCGWLDDIVAKMRQEEMVWGISRQRVKEGADGAQVEREWEARLNGYVAWQQKAHEQKARVARMAMEVLAEESMVRLAETQAARVAGVFEEGLRMLDLTEGQWAKARAAFPLLLERLAA